VQQPQLALQQPLHWRRQAAGCQVALMVTGLPALAGRARLLLLVSTGTLSVAWRCQQQQQQQQQQKTTTTTSRAMAPQVHLRHRLHPHHHLRKQQQCWSAVWRRLGRASWRQQAPSARLVRRTSASCLSLTVRSPLLTALLSRHLVLAMQAATWSHQ
jgi:hypothetical protein